MRTAVFRAALAVVAALALSGCSTQHHVTAPAPQPPAAPAANSPTNAIRLFEWGWNHRDLDAFKRVLPEDFVFQFALGDSAANAFREHPIGRAEMLEILAHVFAGGGSEPMATSVELAFDPTPRVLPDSRLGMNPKWHKEIVTSVALFILTAGDYGYRITGNARFFVVRGDSAAIPADLAAEGVGPDSTRWYIQQWSDETYRAVAPASASFPAAPQPAHNDTWGKVLALYYPASPALGR